MKLQQLKFIVRELEISFSAVRIAADSSRRTILSLRFCGLSSYFGSVSVRPYIGNSES